MSTCSCCRVAICATVSVIPNKQGKNPTLGYTHVCHYLVCSTDYVSGSPSPFLPKLPADQRVKVHSQLHTQIQSAVASNSHSGKKQIMILQGIVQHCDKLLICFLAESLMLKSIPFLCLSAKTDR